MQEKAGIGMAEEAVKLMRCPSDTHCVDCGGDLPFGAWAYFNAETGEAICPECAVERGWSPKQRVNDLIKALELKEDIRTLRGMKKIEANALVLLRKEVQLQRLGERDLELEKQILALIETVQDYLKHCGRPEEKEALEKIFVVIRETQELQKEVREQVQTRLFIADREERRQKRRRKKLLDEIGAEAESAAPTSVSEAYS